MRPCAGAGSRPQLRPSQPARANDAPSLLTMYGMSGAACGARSGGPQACPAGCARHSVRGGRIEIIGSALSAPSIPAIARNACFGLPQQHDGSLGRHRRRGYGLVVLYVRRR